MVTKVRGAFNEFEGSAVVDAEDFAKSTAELTIQAASIDTRQAQRDEHLRSNDFLGMEEYPRSPSSPPVSCRPAPRASSSPAT